MSLAVRLLLALAAVAMLVTALVGFSARTVSRREAERGFFQRIEAATRGVESELSWEATALTELLVPLCQHDSFVDRTLLDLERVKGDVAQLPPGRGIAIRKLVSAQAKALRLDELLLVSKRGQVLGSRGVHQLGRADSKLRELLRTRPGRVHLDRQSESPALRVFCTRRSGSITLGLVGYRNIRPILNRVGAAYGVHLSLDPPDPVGDATRKQHRVSVAAIPELEVTITVSRQPLLEALAQIDVSIILSGVIAVLLAIALAVFVARGLSLPIVDLAAQTREVVHGEPRAVRGRGSREMVQLARSFNRTIEDLTAMRKRLAKTERIAARREVARQVAHEIKNPLAPIQAAVETLRRLRARDSPDFDDYFDEATKTVLSEVRRISDIVSEFSEFARMAPPQFARIDLEATIRSVVHLHDDKEGSAPEVRLKSTPLPPVMADRDQMIQVLTNLVQNGIDATRNQEPRGIVAITLDLITADEVSITVSDNGPGMDPSIRDRMFEPYISTKPTGSGLGLAIVHSIIYEHGGEIEYRDGEPHGAVFELRVPIDGPPLLQRAPQITNEDNPGS